MTAVIHVGSGVVSIPPERGGAVEAIIYEICRFAAGHGYAATVIDNGNRSSMQDGVEFVRVPVTKFRNAALLRLTELLFGFRAAWKIRDIAASEPSVVHLHTVFTALPVVLLRKILPKRARLVYTSHNPAWTDENIDFINALIREIEKFVARGADCVTIGTKEARRKVAAKAGIDESRIRTVYNFADTKKFMPKKRKSSSGRKTVLFVGKLIPNKGIEYLLRAVPLVKEKMKDVRFVIAGPASFESEKGNRWLRLAEELGIEDDVIFTGGVPNDRLAGMYSSADVFCFPTIRETFGVVLAEAMSSGLPVVASKIPVVEEVAGGAAILVPRRDEKAIAEALVRILSDRRLARHLGKKSLERRAVFDKDRVMADYIKLYDEVSG